ncbi:putative Tyrosine-specific transport protein [Gammaproteobacteria bacterium]
MNTNKFVGCTMILIGTTIGAGTLALPTASAAAGFTFASILMLFMWALSIITSLMIIEVNLAFPAHACSYNTMAEQTIGIFGKVITWISYLSLLYVITVAYIAGASDTITTTLTPIFGTTAPNWSIAIPFTLILGVAVLWSTKAVDFFNRGLLSLKGFLLIAAITLIMPHIDVNKLIAGQGTEQAKYLWVAAPTFLTAFTYQFVLPSLRIYIGEKSRELKWIVIVGATCSLVVYLLWLAATLGTIPLTGDNSFTSWGQNSGSIGELTRIMTVILNNKLITSFVYGFTNVAMTTSFLGVTLGLFDFLADGFKRPNTRFGRFQTACLTFIPPLLFALLRPKGFEKAVICAATSVAILVIILPALMVYRLRKNPNLKSTYRMPGGNALFVTVLIIGIILLTLSILASFNLLPSMKI